MIKKLNIIGIVIIVNVWIASSAESSISFTGGDITGRVTIQPTQSLQINDTVGITGTQSLLDDADTGTIRFEMAKMSGYAFGDANNYLRMTSVGSLSERVNSRQSIIGIHGDRRGASGNQRTTGDISVGILNSIDITGMDFGAGQGCNPSFTVDTCSQTISLPAKDNKSEMKQASAFTFTVTAPGTRSDSLTLVPAQGRSGTASFMGVVATGTIVPTADLSTITYTRGSLGKTQSLTSFIPGAVGSYTGVQESSKSVYLSHQVTIGRREIETPPPAP